MNQNTSHVRALARILDASFRVPGTRFRFGMDPVIGIIPVVGDLAGGLMSSYILLLGARAGAPKAVLLRMLANIAIDTVVGVIPLLGLVFDAYWKANTRNLELLQRYQEFPTSTHRASAGFLLLLFLVVALLVVGLIWLAAVLIRWLAGVVG